MNKPSLSLRSLHAAPYEILGLYGALVMDPKRKPTIPSKLSASLKLLRVWCSLLSLRRGCSNHQSSDENRSNHFQPPDGSVGYVVTASIGRPNVT